MKIDEHLLAKYLENFVGFGSYDADFWFIGMEQGGGHDLGDLKRRLDAWHALGEEEVVDLGRYCERLNETRWHGPGAKIQPTLGKMVRVVLGARGGDASANAVRSYQAERLGRSGRETLVAELFPLPSRSVGHWIYSGLTALPYLRSRETYLAELRPKRIKLLRDRIDRHAPRAVVLLGWSYMAVWNELVGSPLDLREEPRIRIAQRGKTVFIASRHPTSYGVTNQYFAQIGAQTRAILAR